MVTTATRISAKLPSFRDWLAASGAQVLEPTNEWEIVRFKAGQETSIIYRNKSGAVRYCGAAEDAWKAFSNGSAWRATPPTRRKRMTPMVRALRTRDGDLCFFCQRPVSEDNESAEHLVAVTHGGPNHISNMFLAHKGCNAQAGHLSAPEKIKIHVRAVIERNKRLEDERYERLEREHLGDPDLKTGIYATTTNEDGQNG